MSKYKISLDEGFFEELFSEMERLSSGKLGHEFVVEVDGAPLIAADVASGMLIPFLMGKMEKVEDSSN